MGAGRWLRQCRHELGKLPGFRPAEAGEFTRRAFENGRLDLTAVEGLADLVFAETEAQRAQAMRQLSGALGGRAEAWRQRLIGALALVEARIDFSDEADVPEDLVGPALHAARELLEEIEKTLRDEHRGERLREGLVVAIAGPPNAGKSSLLNRLARREAAIVSPYAGHHARRDRGASRSRRLSGDAARHRGGARERRPGRAGGRAPGAGARRRPRTWCCGSWTRRQRASTAGTRSESKKSWMVRNKVDLVDSRRETTARIKTRL